MILGIAAALIAGMWILPFPDPLRAVGALAVGVAALAVLFTMKLPLGEVRAPEARTREHLAHGLRVAGYRVAETPGVLVVRVGFLLQLKLRLRATRSGTRIYFQADADPRGWGGWLGLIVLIMLISTGVLAIPALGALLAVLLRFVHRYVDPLLPADGVFPELPAADEVRAALLDGLAEGWRMAEDAFDAARAHYWDLQGTVWLGAILAGSALILLILLSSPDPDVVGRLAGAFPWAAAGAIGFGAPVSWFVRSRFKPNLVRYREWARRLREALAREAGERGKEAPSPSSFEILLDASREVPDWMEARRRAGLSADPGTWFLIFLAVAYDLEFILVGSSLTGAGGLVGVAALLLGLLLGVATWAYYRRWKRLQGEGAARDLAAWNDRFSRIRAKMEQYLRDL